MIGGGGNQQEGQQPSGAEDQRPRCSIADGACRHDRQYKQQQERRKENRAAQAQRENHRISAHDLSDGRAQQHDQHHGQRKLAQHGRGGGDGFGRRDEDQCHIPGRDEARQQIAQQNQAVYAQRNQMQYPGGLCSAAFGENCGDDQGNQGDVVQRGRENTGKGVESVKCGQIDDAVAGENLYEKRGESSRTGTA